MDKTAMEIEEFTGLIKQADPMIALDLLLAAKNGVRNTAIAITETATPAARQMLRNQLDEGIEMHDKIARFMLSKGWLHPYDVKEQFQLDMLSAQTSVQLAGLPLFPDTSTERKYEV